MKSVALCLAPALLAAASCGASRDVVPETHDVRGDGASAATVGSAGVLSAHRPTQQRGLHQGEPAPDAAASETYVHVARRPHGAVALAEARGMPDADAASIVDRLADDLDACAARLLAEGKLVEGAARVVVRVTPNGAVDGLNVKLAPGAPVAANALLCLIAPLKAFVFPPTDAGARGLAIEATWGAARDGR